MRPPSPLHDTIFVQALHDFEPQSGNTTCLSLRAGQIIKVYNQDASGWWDGEVDGHRGWLPMNYVTTLETNSSRSPSPVLSRRSSNVRLYGASVAASTATSLSPSSPSNPASLYLAPASPTASLYSSASASTSASAVSPIMEPILHALALLQSAVRSRRITHFQPSTACVISSVRSVLSATDCLTRESPPLKRFPSLARERKLILSELSRLVAQARLASGELEDEETRDAEMDAMLRLAAGVLSNVRRFLAVARECGISLPDRRRSSGRQIEEGPLGESYEDEVEPDRTPMPSRGEWEERTPRPNSQASSFMGRQTPDSLFGPPLQPESPIQRASGLPRTADRSKSISDLRSRVRSDSVARTGARKFSVSTVSTTSTFSSPSSPPHNGRKFSVDSTSSSSSYAPLMPGSSHPYPHGRYPTSRPHSFASNTSSDSSDSTGGPRTPGVPHSRHAADVLRSLGGTHDSLLSIVAAFIGHVHSHTTVSHPSSTVHLIDMTRETVFRVRELIAVVEAVLGHAALRTQRAREIAMLEQGREKLYVATTALVTAARAVLAADESAHEEEDADKQRLLRAATDIHRAGVECVAGVRLSLAIKSGEQGVDILFTGGPAGLREASLDESQGRGTRRGKHTLSFLGRKATSLSCLKEKYEQDGVLDVAELGELDDTEDEEEEEELAAVGAIRLRDEDETVLPGSRSDTPLSIDSLRTVTPSPGPSPFRTSSRARAATLAIASSTPLPHSPLDVPIPMASARAAALRELGLQGGQAMSRDASSNTSASVSTAATLLSEAAPTSSSSARTSVELDGEVPLPPVKPFPAVERAKNAGRPRSNSSPLQHSTPPLSPPGPSPFALARSHPQPVTALPPPPAPVGSPERLLGSTSDPRDVAFNADGAVTGATLDVLVERLTPHDVPVDPSLSSAFLLTFRLFTSPTQLVEALVARYDLQPPSGAPLSEEEFALWTQKKAGPVRLRVYNFFKTWLETYWRAETDNVVLQRLTDFARDTMPHGYAASAHRVLSLCQKRAAGPATEQPPMLRTLGRMMSTDHLRQSHSSAATDLSASTATWGLASNGAIPPAPIMSKSLTSALRSHTPANVVITEFDPLELARQLTIMESKLYCAVKPEELLELTKKGGGGSSAGLKAMSTLSTRVTGWVAETILNEEDARKRAGLLKFFIKLADRCLLLNNFSTLMAIVCALNSSTISRLRKTWDSLSAKYRNLLDNLRAVISHERNYAQYRSRLRSAFAPALPFVGLYLTDITFLHEGNKPTRASPLAPEKQLINFDKYSKLARVVADFQRFQEPFNLVEVPEVQHFMSVALKSVHQGGEGAADLYRRSLLLEPRQPSSSAASQTTSSVDSLFNKDVDGKRDLFGWGNRS